MRGCVHRIRQLALVILCLLCGPAWAAQPPKTVAKSAPLRIVSIGGCADQWLMAVAKREQIAAVSPVAKNPDASAYFKEAADLPQHYNRIEEILAFKPDLVISDNWGPPLLLSMLERLHIRVERLGAVKQLADLPPVLEKIGALTGQKKQAKKLVADYRRSLAAAKKNKPNTEVLAALYRPNGYSPGQDTQPNDVLATAGLTNLSAKLGMKGSVMMPLENLIYYHPDIWIRDVRGPNTFGLGNLLTQHPAILAMPPTQVEIPLNQWFCITPRSVQAIKTLQDAARKKEAKRP